ncbi:MBL fold metallo-hydrolase [Desulfovibrio inopinatus]|uniref:MBL fold metallo-hydrolase n=1 Tax=Desulfovibrio inopinatus TaxID=102109 RepID=UPI001B7FEF09|nr:MBL fold metallo-hydrolase [Desulfovibrio inopinatus]
MLLILLLAFACLTVTACAILNQAKFGKSPEGDRLERIKCSPHYVDGEFKNQIPTFTLVEDQSTFKIILNGWFFPKERLRPEKPLPTVRLDLSEPNAIDRNQDMLIWLGHSSFFIQLGGKRLLVDPVFSDHGAPFSFLNKIFPGTDIYNSEDMPEIDYLLISHDHWDHLDYPTITALEQKVKTVTCPLGVDADFEYWDYPREKVHEADWNTTLRFENGLIISVVPARHYSGRLFTKNKTLWAGFVIETPEYRVFLNGDEGTALTLQISHNHSAHST